MKTIIAAAFAALAFAAPAMAAEEYQFGPSRPLADQVPTRDTGSVNAPRFDGQYALATPRENLALLRGNSESAVETANSLPLNSQTGTTLAMRRFGRPAG